MNLTTKEYGKIENEQRKTAIVLSGGGAKGSYQAGILKAAMEYGFFPDIVTGTSIGALNGITYMQGLINLIEELWTNMSYETIFGITDKRDAQIDWGEFGNCFFRWIFNTHQKDENRTLINRLENSMAQPEGLEKIIYQNVNEDIVRKSNIDFALNITQVYKDGKGFTGLNETTLTKNEIPNGQIADYVLGSSAFYPLFTPKKIGNDLYIDGGASNNIPLEKALELGANDIIVINVGYITSPSHQIRKQFLLSKTKDVRVLALKPESNIGSTLEFNSQITKMGFNAGYDAGREFFEEYQKMIDFEDKTRKM